MGGMVARGQAFMGKHGRRAAGRQFQTEFTRVASGCRSGWIRRFRRFRRDRRRAVAYSVRPPASRARCTRSSWICHARRHRTTGRCRRATESPARSWRTLFAPSARASFTCQVIPQSDSFTTPRCRDVALSIRAPARRVAPALELWLC